MARGKAEARIRRRRNAIFTAELVSFYSLLALKSSSVGQRRMAFIISGSAGSVKVSEENKQTASAASCEEGTVIRIRNRLQAGEWYSKKGCGNLPSRILFPLSPLSPGSDTA